jgi:beta-galactosidase
VSPAKTGVYSKCVETYKDRYSRRVAENAFQATAKAIALAICKKGDAEMPPNQTPPDWADPLVTGRNRVLTHSPLGAYPDAHAARSCDRTVSPFMQSLNGTWRFRLTPSPEREPRGFRNPDMDDSAWHTSVVPSNWQLDPAIKDQPIYTNESYPFCKMPPEPPKVNPTGWYRQTFKVPASWKGREVFLQFESCDSACKVWVNGAEAGYSQDSKHTSSTSPRWSGPERTTWRSWSHAIATGSGLNARITGT